MRHKLLTFFSEPLSKQPIAGVDINELEKRSLRDDRKIIKAPNPFDSWFEVDVALQIARRGYVIYPQYPFAGRRIDLVVEGDKSKLAVECDGDYWHGEEQYEQDMFRQRQLERCGWIFFRIRESSFRINQEKVLSDLWEKLEDLQIFPKDN